MKKDTVISYDFMIPIVILLIATVLFWLIPVDINIQRAFYRSGSGWFLEDAFPWKLLYHNGNIPALLLSVGSLILLGVSFWNRSLIKYRKIYLYFVLVMAIGPGLIINSILKDNWGRPRPRNIIEFDGKYQYEKPLEIDASSSGKSFPCGHASMGFYLMVPFFLLKRKKRTTALIFLFSGIILGGLIGFARIVQGGHFASDVIWAGGIVYLVSAGFYYLLKLDRNFFYYPTGIVSSRKKVIIISILGLAVIALILLVLMATPYSYTKTYELEEFENYNSIEISIPAGDVKIIKSNDNKINLTASAHGFPWSELKTKIRKKEYTLQLNQRVSGNFTEILQNISVLVPDSIKVEIKKDPIKLTGS